MELPNTNPFDAYVEETRRLFWKEPEGVRHSAADHLTIAWSAERIMQDLSDEQVLQLLSDLYLRRAELDISILDGELDTSLTELVEEAVQNFLIAAVVAALRVDQEMKREDTIRRAAQSMAVASGSPE